MLLYVDFYQYTIVCSKEIVYHTSWKKCLICFVQMAEIYLQLTCNTIEFAVDVTQMEMMIFITTVDDT